MKRKRKKNIFMLQKQEKWLSIDSERKTVNSQ